MRWCGMILVLAAGWVGTSTVTAAGNKANTAADEQTLKTYGIDTTDQALLEFFRKRTLDQDRAKVHDYIRDLGDDAYETRERASAKLVALGSAAEPYLRKALASDDIEVVRRAEECLRLIRQGVGASLPAAAARLLARRQVAGAVPVLLAYLPFAPNTLAAEEVRKALTALAVRDGKAEPALVAALADPVAGRRAAAAEALCRAGLKETHAAVKQLLKDPDPEVRLQVALALANAHDRDAIPVLIDLLGQLPREQSWPADEILRRLAGDQAPNVALGHTEASRRASRQAWADWWQAHGSEVNLAKLSEPPPVFGYTVVVLLDAGRILELDRDNKVRWEIDGLVYPLDFQFLPGNRVLVAENKANRVTERDLKGQVVWEKQVESPLMAQRLPNGNTFIATNSQLMEVNQAGKEVFAYTPPGGEYIMKAEKLPNGEIACVLSSPRFVRMDATGKEIKTFPVNVRTGGGRIDVLPNGHILVPENAANRVVELDGDGKQVWEAAVQEPIAAIRLANGHTLVTSMNQHRAIELDAKGKEVWQYQTETPNGRLNRVNRVYRR